MSKHLTSLKKVKSPQGKNLSSAKKSWFLSHAKEIIIKEIMPHYNLEEFFLINHDLILHKPIKPDSNIIIISHSFIYKKKKMNKKFKGEINFNFKTPGDKNSKAKLTMLVEAE